jgi:hypothetical protein
VTTLVCFFLSAREAAGALGTRHSLRPLFFWANGFCKTSGAFAPRDRGLAFEFLPVIARSEATKQSTLTSRRSGLLRLRSQ